MLNPLPQYSLCADFILVSLGEVQSIATAAPTALPVPFVWYLHHFVAFSSSSALDLALVPSSRFAATNAPAAKDTPLSKATLGPVN
jgi:hypothetical protein